LLPLPQLLLAAVRRASQVNSLAGQALPGELALTSEQGEEVANGGAEQLAQFSRSVPGRRSIDQGDERAEQGAVSRKADGAVEPQAVVIEARPIGQGVEAAVVVEAGEIAVLIQGPENGHGGQSERRTDLREGKGRSALAELDNPSFPRGKRHGW
jgi:hypothetical protein